MTTPDDRMEHKGEELRGEAKERVGRAIGDERLERQGETDKTAGKLKQAGDKVRDAADDVKERLTRSKNNKDNRDNTD